MNWLKRYNPKSLPPLAQSRLEQLNQAIRILEGDQRHLIIEANAGSGRSVFINHLIKLAEKIKRPRHYLLNAGALTSELYEQLNLGDFFIELSKFIHNNQRAVILIDDLDLVAANLETHESRRLTRTLNELIKQGDCRIIIRANEEERINFLRSKTLSKLFRVIKLNSLTILELDNILTQQIPKSLKTDIQKLAKRFYPTLGLPGSALELWQQTSLLAEQLQEQANLNHVAKIISEDRSIPTEAILSNQNQKIKELEANLNQNLVGQSHAVKTVKRTLIRSMTGFRNEQKPVASFLLLGPSGVGKTEIAKIISNSLFDEKSFHRLDMSEFSESHTAQRLIGAPPGYIGYEEGGQLTNPISANPYSLVLLDEIEKAHPKVFDVFLQLLDDGRLTDGQGKTVDFSHTVVVATSNVGLNQIVQGFKSKRLTNHDDFLTQELLPILIQHFRPEFLNRFDAIIVFQPLSIENLAVIAQKDIQLIKNKLRAKNIRLEIAEQTLLALCHKSFQPTFGARPIKRLIQDQIAGYIAEKIIKGELSKGDTISL